MKEAADFLRSLEKKDVVIVYHGDTDGVCSAFLLTKLLEGQGCEVAQHATRNVPRVTQDLMLEILEAKPEIVIMVDFAEDIDKAARRLTVHAIDSCVIDHHVPRDYRFPNGMVYSNPHQEKKTMPCSAYIYDICSSIIDMKKYIWIAATGTISDYGAAERPDMIKKVMAEYPDLFETKEIDQEKLRKTTFGVLGNMLNSASVWGEYQGIEMSFEVLMSCETPSDLMAKDTSKKRMLWMKFDEVEEELRHVVEEFRARHNTEGYVKYMKFESQFGIQATAATVISGEYDNCVVMLIRRKPKMFSASMRDQSGKHDLNAIIQKALEGLDGRGGGHAKASAVKVAARDFPEFFDRFLKLVNQ